jgi:hypothetical protein
MPAEYSVADRSASLTAAGRLGEFRTGAFRAYVREIGVSVGVAGASPSLGVIRPNAIGVTPTTPKTAQAHDPASPAGTVTTATAWGTAPTLPASPVYLRRVTLPATLGAGWVWPFQPGELIIPINSSLLLDLIALSAATATAVDWYLDYYE